MSQFAGNEVGDGDQIVDGLVDQLDDKEVFIKLGFAAGNGLNLVSPFVLSPWAADLQNDVKHINGRDRRYLLEAWYAHTLELGADNRLQVTGGIIDPAFYANENAYANDEFTQFMNEVFVNSRNAFLPAYDWGGALVWKYRDWTFSGIGMNVGENDDGNTIGIGYAYVDGGNLEHAHSKAVETYYRLAINDYLALTADVQYLKDDYLDPRADDVEGWILSMRAVVEF